MHWLDIAILFIVALSAIIAVVRGFVHEALALAGWVVSVWVALYFSPALADRIATWITIPSLRFMAAFCGLFVVTLILSAVLNRVVSAAVRKSALSGTDRALGALFGLLRGFVIVVVLVWLAGFTKFPHGASWRQSFLVGYFESLAEWMRDAVPPAWKAKLKYE